jgi:hypothetical protein
MGSLGLELGVGWKNVAMAFAVFVAFLLGWRPKLWSGRAGSTSGILARSSAQDWLVVGYLCSLLVATLLGSGDRKGTALAWLCFDLMVVGSAIGFTRSREPRGFWLPVLYRLSLFFAVFATFLQLHYILPTVTTRALDEQIYAFDMTVFGFEPSFIFDSFTSKALTEWFSFFYFGYYAMVLLHVFPIMFWERRAKILAAFSLGILFLFCTGHLLYLVVPGSGPYDAFRTRFANQLPSGFWWNLVQNTVEAGDSGARKDIFPSLHTAVPLFMAGFSLKYRRMSPFRYSWPVVVLCASQIVLSTMYLRWHYLLDVLAGTALALASLRVSDFASSEGRFRAENGLPSIFPEIGSNRKTVNSRRSSPRS